MTSGRFFLKSMMDETDYIEKNELNSLFDRGLAFYA